MTLIPYTIQRHIPGGLSAEWFGAGQAGILRTDIREKKDAYLLETEMPGVRKEDIELIRENGVLTISVRSAAPEGEDDYIRRERVFGESKRSFALKNIDEETISARLENGVLFITLPKQKRELGKIEIE
jgi:HSP20 family protein